MAPKSYSRRDFLSKLAFSGAAAEANGNKTLVCIFLRGGADTLNMYIPYANDDYYKLRPNIAIKADVRLLHTGPQNQALVINPPPNALPYKQNDQFLNIGIGYSF